MNALPQIRATIDGVGLHAVHARSGAAGGAPLLLTNGWPSLIFEYAAIIPRLTAAGFDVVAPALPRYGFADLFAGMADELGYDRFLAHGSDMGAGVVEQMRRRHAARLRGAHFSNIYRGYPRPDDPSPAEQAYFGQVQAWTSTKGTYAMLQGTNRKRSPTP